MLKLACLDWLTFWSTISQFSLFQFSAGNIPTYQTRLDNSFPILRFSFGNIPGIVTMIFPNQMIPVIIIEG